MEHTSSKQPNYKKIITAHIILILLSSISALGLISLWMSFFIGPYRNWGLGALIPFFTVLILGNALMTPATVIVIWLQRVFSSANSIHPIILYGVPSVLNMLAANFYFLIYRVF